MLESCYISKLFTCFSSECFRKFS